MEQAKPKSLLRKITAGSILTVMSSGGVWSVYSALDARIRANEVKSGQAKTHFEYINENLKEIKDDMKYIKGKLK